MRGQCKIRRITWEFIALILTWNDDDLDQDNTNRNNENKIYSGYMLKVRPTEFKEMSNVENESQRIVNKCKKCVV